MTTVTEKDLKAEIIEMRERYPRLQDSDLFVAWFLKCFVLEREEDAVASLVGGSKDKSLDAIYIDEQARKVFVVQGKYRQRSNGKSEARSDVTAFANLAEVFLHDDAFDSHQIGLDQTAAARAQEARKRIKGRDYRLQLYYVTMGRCSKALNDEAGRIVRRAGDAASIDLIDGKNLLRLLADYLDGVAPPVPMLELEIENGQGIKLGGVLQRYDDNTNIESWVFPVCVKHVADMYDQSGIRLFARNVRGFLGDTTINRSMEETLDSEPEFFWYYNNGITIVCDKAERITRSGRSYMHIVNPQVINGQQTTRTLHRKAAQNSRATVLVRVISVPRDDDEQSWRFEKLVGRIVAATNWQNAIRPSDLRANDRRQIEIERNLRKLDYQYLRKRQTKSEARSAAGVRHFRIIDKDELAQAVAACDLDPTIVREGKERLFEERYYDQVFPNSDPTYYLPRYWTVWFVAQVARGYPERAYAKWLVTHFVWQNLQTILGTRTQKVTFYRYSERYWLDGLWQVIELAFKAAAAFFRTSRGKGEKAIDVSNFFKRKALHREFEKYWTSHANANRRARFERAWMRVAKELSQVTSS